MIERNISNLFESAFPIEPLPSAFFDRERDVAPEGDIPSELERRIKGRPRNEISLMDWRMVGASPSGSRSYLKPATFMYYVPSILLGGYFEPDFIDFALEALIPHNKYHVPRGEWWLKFASSASAGQRDVLLNYLTIVRQTQWDQMGPANQMLLEAAEGIWSPVQ